ncbi:transposase, partial [Clostridium butyricum]
MYPLPSEYIVKIVFIISASTSFITSSVSFLFLLVESDFSFKLYPNKILPFQNSIPGIGHLTAITLIAEIGDINGFI